MLSTQSAALKRTLNMCSLDPGSCSLVTQARKMDTSVKSVLRTHINHSIHMETHTSMHKRIHTHTHTHTHTRANLLPSHNSHLSLPRISCSSHIMSKWTCIIALAWFVVFVGGYQQPPWCLRQSWSLLQAPQIYIAALANVLLLWGPFVQTKRYVFQREKICNLSNYAITEDHMFLRYRKNE